MVYENLRLDVLLKEKNLFESREKAKHAIENGNVMICGQVCKDPSKKYINNENLRIEIIGNPNKYVSRGAYKLEKALNFFQINVFNKIAVDIGSSTGGFTDVLLQNNIKKVYCIDVGKDQLHPKIRNSKKTVIFEQTDFRNINENLINDAEIIVIDVSFISIEPIIKKIYEIFADKKISIISLIKPQFECGKIIAKKYKGIIKNKEIHKNVIKKVLATWENYGFKTINLTNSPIKGGDGNIEYLLYTTNIKNIKKNEINLNNIVDEAFGEKIFKDI